MGSAAPALRCPYSNVLITGPSAARTPAHGMQLGSYVLKVSMIIKILDEKSEKGKEKSLALGWQVTGFSMIWSSLQLNEGLIEGDYSLPL